VLWLGGERFVDSYFITNIFYIPVDG
jgi:hypothetical protein